MTLKAIRMLQDNQDAERKFLTLEENHDAVRQSGGLASGHLEMGRVALGWVGSWAWVA